VRKGSRYVQSETDREATTNADVATDAAPPSKSRRGSRASKENSQVSYTLQLRAPRPLALIHIRHDPRGQSMPLEPLRCEWWLAPKARLLCQDPNSDGVRPLASRRAPRMPAVKGRQARSSDLSSDELLLQPPQRGTDLDTGPENEHVGRTPSHASSRAPSHAAASRVTSKTPVTSKAKKGRRTRASPHAALSAISDHDDDDKSCNIPSRKQAVLKRMSHGSQDPFVVKLWCFHDKIPRRGFPSWWRSSHPIGPVGQTQP